MEKEELYQVVDAILNRASFAELEVIEKALRRRHGEDKTGLFGFEPGKMAEVMAQGMNRQMESTRRMIRSQVIDFVEKMVRSQAPELSESQIQELLSAWMPTEYKAAKEENLRPQGPEKARYSSNEERQEGRLSPQVLETMVLQFTDYSLGIMEASQARALEKEMGQWPRRYWEHFPKEVQQLISLFLKGAMEEEQFHLALEQLLIEGL